MFDKFMMPAGAALIACLLCAAPCALAVDYRAFRMGNMEVIALADVDADRGGQNRPELLVGLDEANAKKYLVPGAMKNSINAFLLKKDGKIILFDTGLGANGQIVRSLEAAGYKPGDIDAVCITHFHFDHVGGLLTDGKATYTKADLHIGRLERELNGKDAGGFLAAYADRLHAFELGDVVLPGVTAIDARGHTPGHAAFLLESGDDKLLIIADLIHFPGIQFPLPDVAVTYDSDPKEAVVARKRVFDRAAAEYLPVAGMHLPFPGIGWLSKEGTGYGFKELDGKK